MTSTSTSNATKRLIESMSRSDMGLEVFSGDDKKLIVWITQYHVDKSIADEIFEFIDSLHLHHSEIYS